MNCGVTKCVWQNGKKKSAHGVVKPMCRHLGCHVGEDFPCKNLLVGSMTWTWSSWDRHRVYRWNCGVGWQSMPARDPNSPPQYAHLKPNEIGNSFLPPGIPPPALRLRRFLWSFQFAASPGPWWWVPDNGASTACNTVNTTQKIRTGQCISLVGWVAYMHSRHCPIQVLLTKKGQSVKHGK